MLKKLISCILCVVILCAGTFVCTAYATDKGSSVIDLNQNDKLDIVAVMGVSAQEYQGINWDDFFQKLTDWYVEHDLHLDQKVFSIPVIGGVIQGTLQVLVIITLGPLFFMGMIGANVAGHIYDQFREWFAKPAN